jgi:hypothetical protein
MSSERSVRRGGSTAGEPEDLPVVFSIAFEGKYSDWAGSAATVFEPDCEGDEFVSRWMTVEPEDLVELEAMR